MRRTAECVTPKHPDKMCDQISDSILDAYLAQDPKARVAIESMGKGNNIYVAGEITSNAEVNIEKVIKSLSLGLENSEITVNISKQSSFIAQGVDIGGAGDQGIMKGYATSETVEMIPVELALARKLAQHIYKYKNVDGKTQITLNNGQIETIVASFQNIDSTTLKKYVLEVFPEAQQIYTNPAGDWSVGGFTADAGLTGRKLVIDNYGPRIAIGGGCFSGKDPTKVDRSAAYMARKIAVDYLKGKGAKEVFVELAYSIGIKEPVEATAIIDGVSEEIKGYDLSPLGIIEFLDLRKPQYVETAKWGHFGRGFMWDK
jgi:S-adenosylmethionine synthetase